jgi:hypothetical protein
LLASEIIFLGIFPLFVLIKALNHRDWNVFSEDGLLILAFCVNKNELGSWNTILLNFLDATVHDFVGFHFTFKELSQIRRKFGIGSRRVFKDHMGI